MTPLDIIRDAHTKPLTTENGDPVALELLSPLSLEELTAFQSRLPCKLPAEIRELLLYCSGFEGGAAAVVDFTGERCSFEFEEAFPYGLPVAADGFGNFWVVDLLPTSKIWGPIYFACHDAPIILYQSPSLSHFFVELFKLNIPPFRSLIDDVHEDRLFQVWRNNPGVLTHDSCVNSADAELKAFAEELGPSFQIIDMRDAEVGFGFSWGRYGPRTVVRRRGLMPVFAYKEPEG